MLPHQQRVIDEKAELDERLAKLLAFLNGDVVQTLSWPEQARLGDQCAIMAQYSSILGKRIAAFGTDE